MIDFHEQNPLPLRERLRLALKEDLGDAGDVTSRALVSESVHARGEFLAKADGVVSGTSVLAPVFELAGELSGETSATKVVIEKQDGEKVSKGEIIARVEGAARVLLSGERTALNLLCHLSGVATKTAQYTNLIAHTKAKVLDTRKTTPLWRDLEKHAVACGGGENHRFALYDMILIKDNHLALWNANDPAGAVNAAKKMYPQLKVEVEVTSLEGLRNAAEGAAPEMILLDNLGAEKLREAVTWCDGFFSAHPSKKKPLLEASGGITLETLVPIAEAGIDRISVGALTHSVGSLDISLEIFFDAR
jgi:nicotinate-nucleotide pyrophosphorylase (carboxylating)